MTHEYCRTAVLHDEADGADVQEHLSSCADCRRFADDVGRIVSLAPTLYEVPEGLADRVLAATQAAPVAKPRSLWADVRRPLMTSTAIAAVLLLVLGLAAVVRDDKPSSEEKVLLAAATATEEAGSAEMELEGSVELSVDANNGDPQFEELPPEVEAYFEARWREVEAEFERQVAEFERRLNESLDEMDRRINEAISQFGSRPSSQPAPTTTAPPPRERPQRPERLSLSLGINGRGAVSFRDRQLAVDGTVQTAGGTIVAEQRASAFRLAAGEGRVGVRSGRDGSWQPLPRSAESMGAAVLRPDSVPSILRAAADVEAAGRVDLGGESVRHYRFKAEGGYRGEVWIGNDNRVRRMALSSTGDGYTTNLALSLRNYGLSVSVEAPPASAEAKAGGNVLYPFNAPVREALTGR